MVVLIAGETGIAMVHGWTEGIGYTMKGYYTPLWTCACLMVLIFLLIISLFFVFIGLHFNKPGIIYHHVFALVRLIFGLHFVYFSGDQFSFSALHCSRGHCNWRSFLGCLPNRTLFCCSSSVCVHLRVRSLY
jgi:hypothetical protein